MDRNAHDDGSHPLHLHLGARVVVNAVVAGVQSKNKYTRSRCAARQRRFLLQGHVAGVPVNHIWLPSNRKLRKRLQVGDNISMTARLAIYDHGGDRKYGLKFPYLMSTYAARQRDMIVGLNRDADERDAGGVVPDIC